MKILVTGIHGFVGSNLTTVLMKEHTIYGLDIITPKKEGVIKTFDWSDLDGKVLPKVDTIIHLAGKAHDTKNTTDEKAYFNINVGLTETIFNYFLKSSASKFIFFSSVKAVTDTVQRGELTEKDFPNPQTAYGRSKLAAEQVLLKQSLSAYKKVYILRPCMIHGSGNKGNLNLLYQLVSKRIPWPLGAFNNQRSFLSVGNLSFVIGRIIEGDISPGIYHLADDELVATTELIRLIATSKGRKASIWYLPKGMVNKLACLSGYLHLPLNPERLQKLTENYLVSNVKIKKALGIQKMPISAIEGLATTLRSFEP